MARHAHERSRRALLHGQGYDRLGEVREVGRDGALYDAQPALPLDAPRAEDRLRRDEAAQPLDRPRDLRLLYGAAAEARVLRPWPDAALQRRGGLHDGRPGRFARAPHQGARGRLCGEDAPDVAPRQGDGRGEPRGVPRLHREAVGCFGRLDLEVRRRDRRAARAPQVLRVGGLPPLGPRHRGVLCRGLHAGRDRRHL